MKNCAMNYLKTAIATVCCERRANRTKPLKSNSKIANSIRKYKHF